MAAKKRHKPTKYELYEAAVQAPEEEIAIFDQIYWECTSKHATVMREDFCSTFRNSLAWVKSDAKRKAIAIDLDPETLDYGKTVHLAKEDSKVSKRLTLLNQNVLDPVPEKADLITASNFSTCFIDERPALVNYLKAAREGLKSKGVFICDILGGSNIYSEEGEVRTFELEDGRTCYYYWNEESYDPVSGRITYWIDFWVPGEKKRKRVFVYHWRLWSINELRDAMKDAGFKDTYVYWEGTDPETEEGDGKFSRVIEGENCETWIAYVVGQK